MQQAKGTFEIQLKPQPAAPMPRLTFDKQFHGDIEGTSQGEMLASSMQPGMNAGYVAMERVSGTLHGRSGSFMLQHRGTMENGVPTLEITVVPGSGTDALAGIAGSMKISVVEGHHHYELEYQVPG